MNRVIITGANEGFGYSMVWQLLLKQNCVTVLDIQTGNLKELIKEYPERLLAIECDVRDEEAIINAVNKSVTRFTGVDIAIHNACKCTFDSMENTMNTASHFTYSILR